MVEDSASNDEHVFGCRSRPTHARASQACFELLDLAFDCAGANGVAFLVEGLVLHAAFVGMEVAGLVGYVGLSLLEPALSCFLIVRMKGVCRRGQMLAGMIPVHDLHAVGEVIRRQVPDPLCAIRRDAGVERARNLLFNRQLPQGWRESLHRRQHRRVAWVEGVRLLDQFTRLRVALQAQLHRKDTAW